jgi:two-component system response regulator HydG
VTARILVIDDDRDHAESVADILAARGYAVEVAHSGETGVARFRDGEFDVTLMDVKLPGMSGLEAFFECRKIKPDAQVIMMTGFSVEHLVAQAVEDGALGVLYKPFAIDDLFALLERAKPRGMVLVADDDPDFTTSVTPVLERNGYRVQVARTGQEALDKAQIEGVNCLILDLRLPILSGLEVYLRLKEAGRLVPIILVTGYAEEEGQALAHLGPLTRGLLIKPFDPAELLQAVGAVIPHPRD